MLEVQRSKNDIKVLQNFGIMLVLFPRASLQHLNPATDHPLPEFSITRNLSNPLAWR